MDEFELRFRLNNQIITIKEPVDGSDHLFKITNDDEYSLTYLQRLINNGFISLDEPLYCVYRIDDNGDEHEMVAPPEADGTQGFQDEIFEDTLATPSSYKETCRPSTSKRQSENQRNVAPKKKNSGSQITPMTKLNDAEIEVLITATQARPPLWNFSLPLQQRTRAITKRLWEEVSLELQGKLSAEAAKAKFKNLHDTYRRIVQAEQHASGSARIETDRWKFYISMEFLRDSCLIRPTVSNVNAEVTEIESLDDTTAEQEDLGDTDHADSGLTTRTSTKISSRGKSRTSETESAIGRIAEALCRSSTLSPVVLPPPPLDEVDNMLQAAGMELRLLDRFKRMEALIHIVTYVHDFVTKNIKPN